MANLIVLHIPVKLTKRGSMEMSVNEEVDVVYNMSNKYNAMKARIVLNKSERNWHSASDLKSNVDTLDDKKSVKNELKPPAVKLERSYARKQSTLEPKRKESTVEKTLDKIATLVESTAPTTFRLKQLIEIIMLDADVQNCIWQKTTDNSLWQMTAVTTSAQSDYVSSAFKGIGLFSLERVSMNMITVNYTSKEDESARQPAKPSDEARDYSDFMNSIKARITVAEVVNCVKKNAQFTFDFLVLVSIASIIATVGLIDNSTVALVSSMLISPMMGPILAFTFGITVGNRELVVVGVRNESFCLFFCVFYGFIFGLVMARVNLTGAHWGMTESWPTPEMAVRGLIHTLLTGAIVALVSGAGVCLSVLGGNVSTMVGVAISASLLPPTVNAGLLWGHSLMWLISEPEFNVNSTVAQPLHCVSLSANSYQFQYSCRPSLEMFILGNLSIWLTILNIFCIILSGIVMLRVKEVVPKFSHSTPTDLFFKAHMPFIRETLGKEEFGVDDFSEFAVMFSELYDNLETDHDRLEFLSKWQEIVRDLENDPVYRAAMRNLPVEFVRMFKAGRFAPRGSDWDVQTTGSKVILGTPWFVPEKMFSPPRKHHSPTESLKNHP